MSKDEKPKGTGTPGDVEEFTVTYEAEVVLNDDEVPDLPKIFLKSKTLSQSRHWKLIEPMSPRSGWWRLTPDGMRFVLEGVSIMKTAWVYNKGDYRLDKECGR